MTKLENPEKWSICKWMPRRWLTGFIKPNSGETEYIELFPNHFPRGPCPRHMLGGCRSSLGSAEQRDGWRPLVDALWHLIFLLFSIWEGGGVAIVEIHPFSSKINAGFCIASEKCCSLVKAWVGGGRWGGMARTEERVCTYLLKRSIDGWKGNLNVIWKGLQLDPEKSKVPAGGWDGVIQIFGTGPLLAMKVLWFSSRLHLKTFHGNNYIHRPEIDTRWCLLIQNTHPPPHPPKKKRLDWVVWKKIKIK